MGDPKCVECRELVNVAGRIALGIARCDDSGADLDDAIESIRQEAERKREWVDRE